MNAIIVWVLLATGPGLAQPLDLTAFNDPEGCEALQIQLEQLPDNNRRYDCAAFITEDSP
jgi:hypothetical protein